MLLSTMAVKLLFQLVLIFNTFGLVSDLKEGDSCVTPNQENARCVSLQDCDAFYKAVILALDQRALQFARESQCGSNTGVVCCGSVAYSNIPKFTTSSIPSQQEQKITLSSLSDDTVCGLEANPSSRIKGGEIVQLDEFPWLVALEYKSKLNNKTAGIRCGGSLINDRYVLTAAHCIIHREFMVIRAWLGVSNITSDENCLDLAGNLECINSTQKVNVEKRIPHHRYNSRNARNDIGLLRLENQIRFNDYIRPICLPSPNLPSPIIGIYMTVAGWGATENNRPSYIKLKVKIAMQNDSICNEVLKVHNRIVGSAQLCAGGERGKDSCEGDSGGPLMMNFNSANEKVQWYQEGLVSYGIGCGGAGRPAVYTKVSKYIIWIINRLATERGDSCTTPNGEKATCVPLHKCKIILDALKTRNSSAIEFAKESQCGYYSETLVCCGSSWFSFNETNAEVEAMILSSYDTENLPDRTVCGMEKGKRRLIDGEITEIGEFPWMATLEYKSKITGENAGIRCGGSLINNRYVLTAAHCIIHREFELTRAWLGEWQVSVDPDCQELADTEECADRVLKVNIKTGIPHPFYGIKTGKNDIGLLRLEQDIKYTDYIRPICLPPINLPIPEFGVNLTFAGWGADEYGLLSDIKLKTALPNTNCNNKLETGVVLNANQLCAGGEQGKYSCQSDSGGPLITTYKEKLNKQTQWYQEGVVSYGIDCCRSEYPVIYIRVSRYISWIVANIKVD